MVCRKGAREGESHACIYGIERALRYPVYGVYNYHPVFVYGVRNGIYLELQWLS